MAITTLRHNWQNYNSLDAKLSQIYPYLENINDELPLIDIEIEWGVIPDQFKVKLALYLEDATIHVDGSDNAFEAALSQAIDQLLIQLKRYTNNKRRAKNLRQAAFL